LSFFRKAFKFGRKSRTADSFYAELHRRGLSDTPEGRKAFSEVLAKDAKRDDALWKALNLERVRAQVQMERNPGNKKELEKKWGEFRNSLMYLRLL